MGNSLTTETMESAFQRLHGRKPDAEDLAVLLKLQKFLRIPDDDPLWFMIIAFDYYRTLYEKIPSEIDERLAELRGLLNDIQKAGATHPLANEEKPPKTRRRWLFAAIGVAMMAAILTYVFAAGNIVVTTLPRDEIKDLESCWKGAGKTQQQDGHLICFPVVTAKDGGRVIGYRLR